MSGSSSCWGHQDLEAAVPPHRYWCHPAKDTVCESLANRHPGSWVSHLGKYWWPHPPLPTHFPASGLGIKNLTSVLCYETVKSSGRRGRDCPSATRAMVSSLQTSQCCLSLMLGPGLSLEFLLPYCLPICPACGINNSFNKLYLPHKTISVSPQTPSETLQ